MSDEKIAFIHHGIPDTPFIDSSFYKDKFGVEGLLMTTEAMVAEKPKKEKPSAPTMPPENMY